MRIVVAEDQYLLRDGLVRLLESYGHTVVATASTGPETVDAVLTSRPDVAVIDVRMPPTHTDEGLHASLAARRLDPPIPVVILSQHVEQLYARELLADASGGIGYLLKDRVFDADHFIESLQRVADGGTALDPAVISMLLSTNAIGNNISTLTEREHAVLALMAEGLSNTAIAIKLHLSEGTVSKYTTSMFDKLNLDTTGHTNRRVQAVLKYLHSQSDPD